MGDWVILVAFSITFEAVIGLEYFGRMLGANETDRWGGVGGVNLPYRDVLIGSGRCRVYANFE